MGAPSPPSLLRALEANLQKVMVGKPQVIRRALVPLLCGGHLLIEDVPGVGKTTLARALARSIRGDFGRIQFTPDLLPLDLTGSSVFDQREQKFTFHPGPVFTNILLADEINRATPRTQSALLESMEERQVTVDGVTRKLPSVFLVIATQNPVGQVGTFELPETQLDRFLLRLRVGYPSEADEIAIFDRQANGHPLETLEPVLDLEQVQELRALSREVHLDPALKQYAVSLVRASREHPEVSLGASPRGTLALLRSSQVWAFLEGRTYATPDDVKALAPSVLGHRVLVTPQASLRGRTGDSVVDELLRRVPVPIGAGQADASAPAGRAIR
ncbi:MAG: MoxR family ATPase [Planctomycetes bacterium]|nr:MoxR family ATPase [Planctomycetota bacterium]